MGSDAGLFTTTRSPDACSTTTRSADTGGSCLPAARGAARGAGGDGGVGGRGRGAGAGGWGMASGGGGWMEVGWGGWVLRGARRRSDAARGIVPVHDVGDDVAVAAAVLQGGDLIVDAEAALRHGVGVVGDRVGEVGELLGEDLDEEAADPSLLDAGAELEAVGRHDTKERREDVVERFDLFLWTTMGEFMP
jgi:hypothetical protein